MDDATRYGRGGLLPMAVFLTQNAPGLRTSPVKRGYWVVRRVLGEADSAAAARRSGTAERRSEVGLPLREMLAKHRENPACASCHARFDSFGLAFEGYGPVGESANQGSGRPAGGYAAPHSRAASQGTASTGLQTYIRDIARRISSTISAASCWCTRWAGRCMLSDEPLVEQMQTQLGGQRLSFRAWSKPSSPARNS